jgi:ATP adenylyltransferase
LEGHTRRSGDWRKNKRKTPPVDLDFFTPEVYLWRPQTGGSRIAMEAHVAVAPPVGRFAALMADGACARPVYDEVLFETHGCVVTPTLGSILPNWLLVVPRASAINFARLRLTGAAEPSHLVEAILAKFEIALGRAIWFEHGPSAGGSLVGCGVDQAHLHLLIDAPFSFQDFVREAKQASGLEWDRGFAQTAYRSLKTDMSYLLAAEADRAAVAQNVENVGSQFFRRVVAKLIHKPEVWDYRSHAHLNNVRETIRNFGGPLSKSLS